MKEKDYLLSLAVDIDFDTMMTEEWEFEKIESWFLSQECLSSYDISRNKMERFWKAHRDEYKEEYDEYVNVKKSRTLYKEFCSKFSYISITRDVVDNFLKLKVKHNVDMLRDYVLSQDLAEEVVL